MIHQTTKWMRCIGWRYRAALGGALVFAFAWLVACNSPTAPAIAPATAVPVTIVFAPASGGVNPPLPSGTQSPASQTATFMSSQLGITMQYPTAWRAGKSGEYLYGGDDGFFNITAVGTGWPTAQAACESEAKADRKDNQYGKQPAVEVLQIDGQPACLIMPSDDQPASEHGLALLVVPYPAQAGKPQALLQLWADKRHIRDLGHSLRFTGLNQRSTLDASTPAPPARDVRTYTSAAGISFDYPANWFTYTKEAENVVLVMNAPPGGIYALKQGGDFRAISVGLKPADMAGYASVRAYIEATLLGQCFECKLLAVEALPPLPQGYSVTQVTYLGEGERAVRFIANGQHVVELTTTYAPGRRSDARYLEVLDQIAGTLVIP